MATIKPIIMTMVNIPTTDGQFIRLDMLPTLSSILTKDFLKVQYEN